MKLAKCLMKLLLFSLFSVFPGDPRRSFNNYAANSWQIYARVFQGGSVVKNPSDNAGDSGNVGSVPGVGRSPEKAMANHSSILAGKIPWTEEPDGLQSTGSES